MSRRRPLLMDPEAAARKAKDLDPDVIDRFVRLARRMQKKPAPSDAAVMRKWLLQYPELLSKIFDLAEFTRSTLIEHIVSGDEMRAALEASVVAVRQDLGYDSAPVMEKLLIDDILVAWLRVQSLQNQLTMLMESSHTSISMVEFSERRLSISQRRYHAACQTLAKIRELAARNPSLQLNVAMQGGQQVNVAGNLIKKG